MRGGNYEISAFLQLKVLILAKFGNVILNYDRKEEMEEHSLINKTGNP